MSRRSFDSKLRRASFEGIGCDSTRLHNPQNHKNRQVKFLPTLIVGLVFSICIGVTSGLTHFVDASYIRPSLTEETVQQSKAFWQDDNYSPKAKDSQVELTETFQKPILWAMQITLFFGLISFILSFMVTTFMKISEKALNQA